MARSNIALSAFICVICGFDSGRLIISSPTLIGVVRGLFQCSRANDTFPLQFCFFETEQEREFQARDGEIADHLGDVGFVESGDNFGIHDHRVVDDQVGNQRSDLLPIIKHWKRFLLINLVASLAQLDDQRAFIELFIEPRLQRVQHLHGRADDVMAQLFVGVFFHNSLPQITQMGADGKELHGPPIPVLNAISRSSLPFLTLAQPACGTVLTEWPGISLAKYVSAYRYGENSRAMESRNFAG